MKTFFQDLVKHPPVPGRAHGHLPAGILALLVCALALTGCLSRPSLNPQTFSFNSSFNSSLNPPATNSAAGQPVLGLKKLEVAPPFEDRSFVYRTGDFKFFEAENGWPAAELVAVDSTKLNEEELNEKVCGCKEGRERRPGQRQRANEQRPKIPAGKSPCARPGAGELARGVGEVFIIHR